MTFYIYPLGRTVRRSDWDRPVHREEWNESQSQVVIPLNVQVTKDDFILTALVPGLKAEELNVQVENDTITLQGELKDGVENTEGFLLRERPVGKFYRVIRLPEPINARQSEAELVDGVLTLRIPKAEEARPRTIKVNTAH